MSANRVASRLLAQLDHDGTALGPNPRRVLGADVISHICVGRLRGPIIIPVTLQYQELLQLPGIASLSLLAYSYQHHIPCRVLSSLVHMRGESSIGLEVDNRRGSGNFATNSARDKLPAAPGADSMLRTTPCHPSRIGCLSIIFRRTPPAAVSIHFNESVFTRPVGPG